MNELILWRDMIQQKTTEDITISLKNTLNNLSNIPKSLFDTFNEQEYSRIDADILDFLVVYTEEDLKNKSMDDELKKLECNFCVLFSAEKIINEILLTYSNGNIEKNILDQVIIDFPRMDLFFNSKKCSDIITFKQQIDKFKKYKHSIIKNLYNLLMMFSTQSSFFYPFHIVNNIYSQSESNIFVFSDKDRPSINIVEKKNSIEIILRKNFTYLNIDNKEIINKFYTFMILTIDLYTTPVGYFYSEFNYSKADLSMLFWIKEI